MESKLNENKKFSYFIKSGIFYTRKLIGGFSAEFPVGHLNTYLINFFFGGGSTRNVVIANVYVRVLCVCVCVRTD